MTVGVFAGTFDPITNGHVQIITRACKLFSKVVVAIPEISEKQTTFDFAQRLSLTKSVLADIPGVEVKGFSGLLATFARQLNAQAMIRGLRGVNDTEYEFRLAYMNAHLSSGVETIFLATAPEDTFISSSLVKEVARLGGEIAAFVPPLVVQALQEHLEHGA